MYQGTAELHDTILNQNTGAAVYLSQSAAVFNKSNVTQTSTSALQVAGKSSVYAESSSFSGTVLSDGQAYFLHNTCQFSPPLQERWAASTSKVCSRSNACPKKCKVEGECRDLSSLKCANSLPRAFLFGASFCVQADERFDLMFHSLQRKIFIGSERLNQGNSEPNNTHACARACTHCWCFPMQ